MDSAFSLNIRFQNRIRKFPWRQKFSHSEFLALIANVFNLKTAGKFLELRDLHGIFSLK